MTANAFRHPPVYSPWFTLAEQAPWEPGVYEVATTRAAQTYYAYWDGAGFLGAHCSVAAAEAFGREFGPSRMLLKRWRGIVPPSRLPRFITETWGQACARVPSLSEFADKPVSASRVAEVLYLADCVPGYELMQFGGLPGLSFIFRRRDPL